MIPWQHITLLGESLLTLPAAAAIIVLLLVGRAWRMAFWWALLFGAGMVVVIVTKIAFIGWGIGSQLFDFTGASGHATRATALYPVIFYLLLKEAPARVRHTGIAAGLALGVLVAISRVVLRDHSVSEVVAGCLLGAAIGLGFMWLARPLPKPSLRRWLPALGLVVLLPTTQAEPAPTADWMNAMALYLSGHERPHVRTWGPLAKPAHEQPAHESHNTHQMPDSRAY
jgi:membrane-associated phospholipid phosphatase